MTKTLIINNKDWEAELKHLEDFGIIKSKDVACYLLMLNRLLDDSQKKIIAKRYIKKKFILCVFSIQVIDGKNIISKRPMNIADKSEFEFQHKKFKLELIEVQNEEIRE